MYNKIVNPKTNRSVSINSKLGKKIIRDYVRMIGGLGRWSSWAEEDRFLGGSYNSGRRNHKYQSPWRRTNGGAMQNTMNEDYWRDVLSKLYMNWGQLGKDQIEQQVIQGLIDELVKKYKGVDERRVQLTEIKSVIKSLLIDVINRMRENELSHDAKMKLLTNIGNATDGQIQIFL